MSDSFLNVCRCCLNDEQDDLLDMKTHEFQNNERILTYYQGYRECSGLQTNEIFILPSSKGQNTYKVCKVCVVQLESCFTFRDLCRQANTILTDRYLMQAHNESVLEERQKPDLKRLQHEDNFLEPMSEQVYPTYSKPIVRDPSVPVEKYPCPKCEKSFKYVSLLNQHALTHGPPKVRKFRCQICMASYKHHLSLSSHMRTAHNIVDPNAPAERRPTRTAGLANRQVQHFEMNLNMNSEPAPMQTDDNGLIMDIKAEPLDEVVGANGDEEEDTRFKCMDCDQTFQYVEELNQHMTQHDANRQQQTTHQDGVDDSNTGSQKNKCNQCPAGPFRTPSGLYHHMQTTHNFLRYTCTYCHKQFTRKQTLNEHNCKAKQLAEHPIVMAVHNQALANAQSGVLNCPYCDYQTDMRENFQEHLEEVHTHSYNYNGQSDQSGYEETSLLNPEVEINEQSQEQNEDAMRMFCYENLLSPQVTLETDYNNSVDFNNSTDYNNSHDSVSVPDQTPPPIITNGSDGKNKYQCGECSRSFQYLSYYKQHMISHSTVKNYKCTYCPSTYKHEKSLIEHLQKHKSGKNPVVPYRAFASVNPTVVSGNYASTSSGMLPIDTSQSSTPSSVSSSQAPPTFTPIKIETVVGAASPARTGGDSDSEADGGDNDMADETFSPRGSTIQKDPKTGKFYCKICDKHYQYLSNYKQHMVRHSDIKKFKCTMCPMTYKTEKSYIGHMKGHEDGVIPIKPVKVEPSQPVVKKSDKNEENFYKCKQCDKTLQSQGGLYHHVQTVHKNFRFFCKLCHQTFTTKKSLQRHMFTHKEKAFMYNCAYPDCRFFTNIKQRLAVHLLNAHNQKYKEEVHGCLKNMSDPQGQFNLSGGDEQEADDGNNSHYNQYEDDDQEQDQDQEVELDYEGEEEQEMDEQVEGDEDDPIGIGTADEEENHSISLAPEVIMHESDANDDDSQDPLNAVNPPSTSTRHFTPRRRGGAVDEEDCMIVDESDRLNWGRQQQKRRRVEEMQCPQCPQMYATNQQLLQHISMSHSAAAAPVKRFKCPQCPAAFTVEKNLEFHMKTHKSVGRESAGDPENMVQCPQCDKTLYSKSGLYHHIKSRHENVKYACKLCDKEFTTKDMLWQHSFHHREDCPWPFICKEEGCEFRTKGKSLYQTHLKTVHGVKYDDQLHGYHDLSFQEIIDSVLDRSKLKKKKIRMS